LNTRILLVIIFYLIFAPVGLFLRLFGKDPLDRKINRSAATYWHHKEKREAAILDYERQF
jgi:hypothetical protein